VGIIIPPSIIFIVYGFLLNLSISDLFIGGMLPGILMVFSMQLCCWYMSRKFGWGDIIKFQFKRIIKAAFGAWLGFFAIGLVIWGIYTGKFSPTEAAGVTAGFCLLVGLIMHPFAKKLDLSRDGSADGASLGAMLFVPGFHIKELPNIILRSGQITGMLVPLIAISVVMQQVLSLLGAKDFVTSLLSNLGGYYPILFACMLIVLAAGTILESLPNTIILAPILAPIAAGIGVNPIHFAVIFLVGDAIGFITPPYGLNLYVASGITGIPYFRILRFTVPYLLALLACWIVIALVPELSTVFLGSIGK
jgi:TRAP-type C4-dicarboxylate transport system permease large subunit